MKLATAIKRLEKAGYKVDGVKGSYDAVKGNVVISFFENKPGMTGKVFKYFNTKFSSSPTYCKTLKSAMS